MSTHERPLGLSTTGVGSLPHTQLELALQMALGVDIPYAPQLPRHGNAELMIPQALEGLPGMRLSGDGGAVEVDAGAWSREGEAFARALDEALAAAEEHGGQAPASIVEAYQPSPLAFGAWRPFLWEIEARRLIFAKTQIAGPTTLRWLASLSDGRRVAEEPLLERTMLRLVWARAHAMARAIRERGARPIVCIDEPGLYALDPRKPAHLVYLSELKLLLVSLRRAGALTAVHCCSNTAWASVLGLGADYLSIDVRLSLAPLLQARAELDSFARAGGRLILGIVPTDVANPYDLDALVATTAAALTGGGAGAALPLGECLLSPACGLALRAIPDVERTFEHLREAQRHLRSAAAAR
jgi:hypothetical protein